MTEHEFNEWWSEFRRISCETNVDVGSKESYRCDAKMGRPPIDVLLEEAGGVTC